MAHPNVQQLLASIWYEGLPGFRQMNMILQFLEVCRIGILFPFFSLAYVICPWAAWSQKLRKPFIKFICTSSSYFTFLCEYKGFLSQGTKRPVYVLSNEISAFDIIFSSLTHLGIAKDRGLFSGMVSERETQTVFVCRRYYQEGLITNSS